MSKINGEKARAAIAKKRRTAQRQKDRALRAQLTGGSSASSEQQPAKAAK